MNKQTSSAWKRKSTSSRGGIETCQSSLVSETGFTEEHHRIIPFLLHCAEQEWVVNDLCELLNQHGYSSLLCHIDEMANEAHASLAEQLNSSAATRGYCLLPMLSAQTVLTQKFDHLVMLVPANLDGVRTAYRKIKLLAARETPEIGIVMVGPRDQHAAWRYFRKLGVGTLRYLDVPLLNLGFLPAQVTPQHSANNQHRETFLARVSERLTRSDFFSALKQDTPGNTL